jgi:hypothetical protein
VHRLRIGRCVAENICVLTAAELPKTLGYQPTVTSLWLTGRAEQPWAVSKLGDSPGPADVVVVGAGIIARDLTAHSCS